MPCDPDSGAFASLSVAFGPSVSSRKSLKCFIPPLDVVHGAMAGAGATFCRHSAPLCSPCLVLWSILPDISDRMGPAWGAELAVLVAHLFQRERDLQMYTQGADSKEGKLGQRSWKEIFGYV